MTDSPSIPSIRAIVTGHSRGLGEALAEHLLSLGVRVLALSRTRNAALAARFGAGSGDLLEEAELDLADPASLEAWLAGETLRRFAANADTLLLINNAGVLQPVGPIASQTPGAIARAVSLNVATPLMLAAALAATPARERRIVHISSGAARQAYPGWSIYCATKAALDHHARAVALDGDRTLRVCSVAPGVVDTGMQAEIRATDLAHFPLREKFDALKREGQLTTPAESARKVIGYALSDAFGETPVADVRDLA